MFDEIKLQTQLAVRELLDVAGLKPGELFVIGCSSSEIMGGRIGKNSSPDAGRAVVEAALPLLKERGLFLAAQCCEHLNRALVVEREAAEKFSLEIVSAVPQLHAGGSLATAAFSAFKAPVLVEFVKASAGLDIGNTIIGMHLKHVAVPVRLSVSSIGQAPLVAVRTRPKFIGGERAVYN